MSIGESHYIIIIRYYYKSSDNPTSIQKLTFRRLYYSKINVCHLSRYYSYVQWLHEYNCMIIYLLGNVLFCFATKKKFSSFFTMSISPVTALPASWVKICTTKKPSVFHNFLDYFRYLLEVKTFVFPTYYALPSSGEREYLLIILRYLRPILKFTLFSQTFQRVYYLPLKNTCNS